MDFHGSSAQTPNPVFNDDNERQGIYLDEGHAGSQYSDPSLPGDGSGSYRHSIPTYDAEGYNAYQYLENLSLPQPDPVSNPYPQQVYPGDFLPEPTPHHASRSEAGHSNPPLPEHNMEQEAEHNWMTSHWIQPQQPPYFKNAFVPNSTYPGHGGNDVIQKTSRNLQYEAIASCTSPHIAARGSTPGPQVTLYSEQQSYGNNGFEKEMWNDCQMNIGEHQSNSAALVSSSQCFEQEAPWSSENKKHDHQQMLMSEVTNLVRKIDSNGAGGAVNDDGGASGPGEYKHDQEWSQFRIDTIGAENNPTTDQIGQPDFPWPPFGQNDQSGMQGSSRPGNPPLVQESLASQFPCIEDGLQRIPIAAPNPKKARLSVHTQKPSRSRRSSNASVASSESFQCPRCPATFSGLHGRGNWGRHNRQKHRGEIETFSCEMGCNKIYLRKDALQKHYRSRSHRS